MDPRLLLVNRTVKYLLNKHWKHTLPIPPELIAEKEGLIVEPNSELGECSGCLLQKDDKWTIQYNPSEDLIKQRFAIAHSLGHYFLDKESFKDYTRYYSMSYYDPREILANYFALELLMPELAVNILVKQRKIYSITKLADIFEVSTTALKHRLKSLNFL
jgi:Zn-dependent peptidase ImmA (M78 family)